ncbi:heparinase II/III family protein [Rhodovibrionaceae bacterium A322]
MQERQADHAQGHKDDAGKKRDARSPGLVARYRAARQLPQKQLLGRLGYGLKTLLFSLSFYKKTLTRISSVAPVTTPPDPWPGKAERGVALTAGRFELAGTIVDNPEPLWAPADVPQAWINELHSFSWLRDLRASGGDTARRTARELVANWLDSQNRWDPQIWSVATLSRRLSHWLGQYDFYATSADFTFRQRLLEAAGQQASHLSRCLPGGLAGTELIYAAKGLVIAGACLPEGEKWLKQGLEIIRRELPLQILPDGGHVERSPARHLAVLRDLIDIKSILHAAEIPLPGEVQTAIESMAPMLRLFQHADGGLTLFNGSSAEVGFKVDMVLQRADGRGRPRLAAPQSGFQRLQAGRTLIVCDSGRPPPPGYDSRAHAGTLSFEMSVGRERLIVNCGAPGPEEADSEWQDLLRATAAHSTLCLDDYNSAPLAAAPVWKQRGLHSRPETVQCRREEDEGATLLELSHDGYKDTRQAVHHRRFFLSAKGDDLRGEDRLAVRQGKGSFVIRFHLHPDVSAGLSQDGQAVLLRLPKGGGWRLRASGANLQLEDSIYLGDPELRRSQQVVLRGDYESGETTVKWAIQRQGARTA